MQWAKKQTGFTIVELLIVVIVIAILATITIVSFNAIQNRAQVSAVRADINGFAKKVELLKVSSSNDQYPLPIPNGEVTANKSLYVTSRNNWYYCVSTDRKSYALGVATLRSGGYVYHNGRTIEVPNVNELNDANTCGYVDRASGSSMGYIFDGNSGIWSSWVGGN